MIVFDASTLILLAKAELLERFLRASRQHALIPREVEREVCDVKDSFDAALVRSLIVKRKIAVVVVKRRGLFEELYGQLGLGVGEAAAVALAVARRADLVGIDDRMGINACRLARMPFTTALAILVRMHEHGVLTHEAALVKLAVLEREGRYKRSMIMDARSRLEAM